MVQHSQTINNYIFQQFLITWKNTYSLMLNEKKQDTELYVIMLYNPDYVNKYINIHNIHIER